MINENPKLNNYHLTDSRAARLAENRRMLAENRSQSPTSQAPSVPSTSTAESTAGTPQNFISNLIRRLYDRLTGRAGLNGTG
ncbi:MAG: hypothetical protein LBV33_03255, partial [Lachnospiraceae bacterium]|nr:hypothetical protein [Lachnospiraceae bacterium]